jgi:hypothetical protein
MPNAYDPDRHFSDGASERPVPIDQRTDDDIVTQCARPTRQHDDCLNFKQIVFFSLSISRYTNEGFFGVKNYIVQFQCIIRLKSIGTVHANVNLWVTKENRNAVQ